jgi:hypothetical protein
MINALLTLFGAILAVIGGFLHQLYQNCLNQKREDRELLHQAEEILIEMEPYLEEVMTPSSKELSELSKRLVLIASRIWTKGNLDLAEKLIGFAKLDSRKTKDNAIQLLEEIATKTSKALDRFHKWEADLFKKAAEEMSQIMKNQDEKQGTRKL